MPHPIGNRDLTAGPPSRAWVKVQAVAWDWIAPLGSGVIGVAGLLFGWASSGRSQRQTAALAREGNEHARALASAANEHTRRLEQLRYDQAEHERRQRRLEESSLEIATTVIRLSEAAGATVEAPTLQPGDDREELVRVKALVSLFSVTEVRDGFDQWRDRFDKLRYAVERVAGADDGPVQSVRDLHSTRDMWLRQARDARLKEIDARERLLEIMSKEFRGA